MCLFVVFGCFGAGFCWLGVWLRCLCFMVPFYADVVNSVVLLFMFFVCCFALFAFSLVVSIIFCGLGLVIVLCV